MVEEITGLGITKVFINNSTHCHCLEAAQHYDNLFFTEFRGIFPDALCRG